MPIPSAIDEGCIRLARKLRDEQISTLNEGLIELNEELEESRNAQLSAVDEAISEAQGTGVTGIFGEGPFYRLLLSRALFQEQHVELISTKISQIKKQVLDAQNEYDQAVSACSR